MVFLLLEDERTAYQGLELVNWLGRGGLDAGGPAQREGFEKTLEIARENGSPSEKKLAIECLACFPEFMGAIPDMNRAKADFAKSAGKSAEVLASMATKYEDVAPLVEPLGEYSDGKNFFAISAKWLTLTWSVPSWTLLADLLVRFKMHAPMATQELFGLISGQLVLGTAMLASAWNRFRLRERCQECLAALSHVQDESVAGQVLDQVRKSQKFPEEPVSSFFRNVSLFAFSVLSIPGHSISMRMSANFNVRNCMLKLAETYARKFDSCAAKAGDLAQGMAEVVEKPFFRKWAKMVEFPFYIGLLYKPLLERLHKSFDIEI
jgi:hypothetical protein